VDRSDVEAKGFLRDDNVTPIIDILAGLQEAEYQSPKINYELMKRKSVNTLVLQQNKKTKPPSPHIKNHKSFSQLPRADVKEMISPYRLTGNQDVNGIHRNNILDHDPESLTVIDDISKMSKSAFYKKVGFILSSCLIYSTGSELCCQLRLQNSCWKTSWQYVQTKPG